MKIILKSIITANCLIYIGFAVPVFSQTTIKPVGVAKPTTADSISPAKKILIADTILFKKYKDQQRVFNANLYLTESDGVGAAIPSPLHPFVEKGQGFEVVGANNSRLVLKLWVWQFPHKLPHEVKKSKDFKTLGLIDSAQTHGKQKEVAQSMRTLARREELNFKQFAYKSYVPSDIDKPADNVRYFSLPEDSLEALSNVYKKVQNWDITFGVLTTPFKLRFNRFAFTSSAGLGTAVYFQKKFYKDWTWGAVVGFSLTSVTLDAASTNVYPDGTNAANVAAAQTSPLTTSTTRPAFTPSLSYVISYKNINFTIGSGVDIIGKPTSIATASNPEAGWIYNGKPWIGIGFGFSLFGNSTPPAPSTAPTTGQKPAS